MTEKKGFSCRLGAVNNSAVTLHQSSGVVNIPLEQIKSVYVSRDNSIYLKVASSFVALLVLILLVFNLTAGQVPWLATTAVALPVLALMLFLANWLGGYAIIIESEKGKNKLALKKKSQRIGELFASAISTAWENSAPADWGFLRSLDELAHYSTIIGYINHFKQNADVLDVGCGDGLFQEKLQSVGYNRYLGFDMDTRLIKTAQNKQNEHTHFKTDSIEEFSASSHFDAIVFNEVLYYASDPVATFTRYATYLNEDGVILISMFHDPQSTATWELIDAEFEAIDSVTITNRQGTSWQIKCYQPA